MKHSKLADGIDQAIADNNKLLPQGVEADQVYPSFDICSNDVWLVGFTGWNMLPANYTEWRELSVKI